MSFCIKCRAALCDASALQCAASVPGKKHDGKNYRRARPRGAAPKNAGAWKIFGCCEGSLSKGMEQFQLLCQVRQILTPVAFSAPDALMTSHILNLPYIVCFEPVHYCTCPELPTVF